MIRSFHELIPRFIQSTFSYITFFLILEDGYEQNYRSLNKLNNDLDLNLKTNLKKPKRDPYFFKLDTIRNKSIAHWGQSKDTTKIDLDSIAGRSWGLSFVSQAENLLDLEFGNNWVVGASDRKLKSFLETHEIRTRYLKEYDYCCAELLTSIKCRLPISRNGLEFMDTQRK